MLVRTRTNRTAYLLLGGMQNGGATWKHSLAVSCEGLHRVTIWASNYVPKDLSKRRDNICAHKDVGMNVCSSFIHNSPKLQTTSCVYERQHGQTHCGTSMPRNTIQPWKGTDRWDVPQLKSTGLSEKSQAQKTTYYIIPIVWHSRKSRTTGWKADQRLPRARRREDWL